VLLGVVLLALVMRPRSDRVVTDWWWPPAYWSSWIVAMWLFTTNHQPMVFRLLVLPGGWRHWHRSWGSAQPLRCGWRSALDLDSRDGAGV
jgi:hypothetical protein